MNKLLSINALDRLLKNDDQDIARCERKGTENGKANTPASSIKTLSKFEIDEKSKVEKAIEKLSNEVDLNSKQLENQRIEILRKLSRINKFVRNYKRFGVVTQQTYVIL